MEKGSFHTSGPSQSANHSETRSGTSLTRELDHRVKNIPLPTQMPRGVDFTEIPAAALKSATLESLISQNEDLMARLSVTLRKTGEIESKSHQLEQENQAIKARFETLKEQFLLLQEKDRMGALRNFQILEENAQQKTQLQRMEKLYADILSQAKAFQNKVIKLERNFARLRKGAKGVQERAKIVSRMERELVDLKTSQASSRTSYESRLADTIGLVESLKNKAQERDEMFEAKTKLENQLIHERRQADLKIHESEERIADLDKKTADLRIEVKELLVDREDKAQEIARLTEDLPNLQADRQRLIEQVESLQALWNHKQRELEQADEKNKNLQKLNQSISLALNDQRKKMHALETELETERMANRDTVRTLKSEIQMLQDQMRASPGEKL